VRGKTRVESTSFRCAVRRGVLWPCVRMLLVLRAPRLVAATWTWRPSDRCVDSSGDNRTQKDLEEHGMNRNNTISVSSSARDRRVLHQQINDLLMPSCLRHLKRVCTVLAANVDLCATLE